ncbi:MAG: bifunctional nitrogenase iron-molybdenum cofactor biosynthesis protein NifEN [Alphaproteobacteria bacterium]|jgi:nitrogenase molybdenum-iron cofactor biosynthesis protein NifE/nitrogenase molybdenum-iron cofactor biosynthesis protein NifN|nr:bifunctional nitrogenase iron-molybdenum cofactor biosynthesis protein NifEN [Alphaproteobacteria bacterium]
MIQQKVQHLFDEPGCATNRDKSGKERRKGCAAQLTPGAAAGGCAFDGAKIALQPIADAAHLVHGPLACEGNSWDSRHSESSGPTLYRTGFTTDLSELDIIQGGEKKLLAAIGEIAERHAPPAIFVYATCVTALIGDDLDKVCEVAGQRYGLPVVPVMAPGFVGSKNFGNRLAGETLLQHVIGSVEPEDAGPTDINIIGDFNLAGELWQITPLFDRLGIRLRASISGDGRYNAIAGAHRARVNMVVCSQALITLARKMEERWGIPYFEGSFYGISDTSEALRTMARLLVQQGAPADLVDRTEALIAEEEGNAWTALAPYQTRLTGKRVLLYTGGVKSWSVVSALQEVGLTLVGTSVRKSTEEDKDRVRALMGEDANMVGQIPAREMDRMFRAGEVDVLLSGGRTQFTALKAGLPWVDINQERHHAFAGYEGMVELVRRIDLALANPIWPQVRGPAPGDDGFTALPVDERPETPVEIVKKACAVNPLKSSAPLGGALAFLGVDGTLPLFHGAQGCTAFSLVLLVRHFREPIPLQTTAMNEVSTILGGAESVEQAIENIRSRAKPQLIGLCTTALTETRGEDMDGDLTLMRRRRAEDWAGTEVVLAPTPDYAGSLPEGWAAAVTAMIETLTDPQPGPVIPDQVAVLAGSHLTPGDVDALRETIEAFGLTPVMLPDLAGSLDGHVPDAYIPTSFGGTPVEAIRTLGRSALALAVGEHMRGPAEALAAKADVPFTVLDSVTGLRAVDALTQRLSEASGRPVPAALRRQRARLLDAMLDAHFFFGNKRVAIAAEPDALLALGRLVTDMGAEIGAAVTTSKTQAAARVPADRVLVGDLDDLEQAAPGCDLLLTHSHGRQAAGRLGIPHIRIGFPIFDRLGAADRVSVGYRGTRDLIVEIGNVLMAAETEHHDHHAEGA